MTAAPGPASAIAVSRELDRVMRADRGRLLAILAAGLRDLGLAEEVLQEAAVSALAHWGRSGLPASPSGWLLQVARRKAIDRLRGAARDGRKAQALATLAEDEAAPEPQAIPDERLRLIFACCHPALEPKSRVALTLRTVCGLTTPEIARAFLDAEPTMGQRISRAKAKIAAAGIPFSVPEAEHWPERLDTVLTTVYLIFTTGYVAGPDEPRDLCLEAEYLIRLIDRLRPGDAEIEGALAMMLLTAARRAARIGPDGASLPPGEQDRSLWDADRIAEGRGSSPAPWAAAAPARSRSRPPSPIARWPTPAPTGRRSPFSTARSTRHEPTPVVRLNAAVAIAEAGDPARGLAIVEGLWRRALGLPALARRARRPSCRDRSHGQAARAPIARRSRAPRRRPRPCSCDYAKTIPDKTVINGISGALETTWVDPAPNFFRFNLDGAQWGAGLGTYVVNEKGWNRVATVSADYSFGYTNFLGFAVDFCRAGGEIVERFWVPLGSADFGGVIAALPDDVDAIYLGMGGTDAINFLNQFEQAGAETNLIGGTIMADQTVLTSRGRAKDALIGTPTSGPLANDNPDPAWTEYVAAYQAAFPEAERFPTPSLFGVGYYIATLAALDALNEIGGDLSDGQAKFHAALADDALATPLGPVSLNENRQASGTVFINEVVDDGAGGLKLELKATAENVTQTLGMTADEFRAMGLPSRDTPDCAALGGAG
jgi:branched-chain amino acid transport system substrate-binding protein